MKSAQELNQYISQKFYSLKTNTEQRIFIENFRFLMMSNDTDFENFYSHKVLEGQNSIPLRTCFISSTIYGCYLRFYIRIVKFYLMKWGI